MSPRLLLATALGFTLVFNVVWASIGGVTTPEGVLSVAAAAGCTLIVPAALHLWPQVPAPTWWLRSIRAVVMTGICVSAAITSFSHSVDVLLSAGWTDLTAWSVTGGAELLVALSTMALRKDVPRASSQTPVVADLVASRPLPVPAVEDARTGLVEPPGDDRDETSQHDRPASPGTSSLAYSEPSPAFVPERPRPASRDERRKVSELRKWIEDADGETPSPYAVKKRFGGSHATAKRLLELAADEPLMAVVNR